MGTFSFPFLFIFLGLWATLGSSQDLLLVLCSCITTGRGILWGARDQTWLDCMQEKCSVDLTPRIWDHFLINDVKTLLSVNTELVIVIHVPDS